MIMVAYVGLAREPLGLLASTGYLLARVGSESRRRFVQALEEHDITLAQYGVLMILGRSRRLRSEPWRMQPASVLGTWSP